LKNESILAWKKIYTGAKFSLVAQFAIIHARGAHSVLDFFLEQRLDEVENHIHQGVDVDYVHLA
jgi:hypothetical protein